MFEDRVLDDGIGWEETEEPHKWRVTLTSGRVVTDYAMDRESVDYHMACDYPGTTVASVKQVY